MVESYKKNRRERKCIVRYENLMREPEDALAEIVDFLGIDARPDNLKSALEFAQKAWSRRHETSLSPTASIGRWKTELPERMQEHATQCFSKYRKVFSYA